MAASDAVNRFPQSPTKPEHYEEVTSNSQSLKLDVSSLRRCFIERERRIFNRFLEFNAGIHREMAGLKSELKATQSQIDVIVRNNDRCVEFGSSVPPTRAGASNICDVYLPNLKNCLNDEITYKVLFTTVFRGLSFWSVACFGEDNGDLECS